MDTVFEEYASLKLRMAKDKAREKVLKEQIEELYGQEERTEKMPFGTFKMVPRKTWKYTEMTEIMAEDLKIQQIEEQEQEIATHTTAYSLRFNAKK